MTAAFEIHGGGRSGSLLLAQIENVNVFNAVTNGGAFALLAYLVIWGLPQLMKSVRDDRESAMNQIKEDRHAAMNTIQVIVNQFALESKYQRDYAATESKYEREQCERHFNSLATIIETSQRSVAEAIRNSADAIRGNTEAINAISQLTESTILKSGGQSGIRRRPRPTIAPPDDIGLGHEREHQK